MADESELDVIYLLERFELKAVRSTLSAEIIDAIEAIMPNIERIRYSFIIDIIRHNLKYELENRYKDAYDGFIFLLLDKLSKEYLYNRSLIFLLWTLVSHDRHLTAESISDWMFEVVEIYFDENKLNIDHIYRNAFEKLSSRQ